MIVSYTLRLAAAALLCTCALQAQAAITCSLTPTSVNLNYVNGQAAHANANGSITLNCTRLAADPTSTNYWVGITLGSVAVLPRQVFRHGGGTVAADQLNVNIFKNATTTDWTNSGGGLVSGTLDFGTGTSASVSLTYDFRVPSKQTGNTAGIYNDVFTTNLQLTSGGPMVASATFTPTVSITAMCFVGQVASGNPAPGAISPTTMTLNYASFGAAQTTTMTFTVDCTNTTPYSMDLSPSSGVLLGLAYTVMFDNGTATKTGLTGSGLAQPYTLTAAIAAGQAGACTAATCTATQATTVTITY